MEKCAPLADDIDITTNWIIMFSVHNPNIVLQYLKPIFGFITLKLKQINTFAHCLSELISCYFCFINFSFSFFSIFPFLLQKQNKKPKLKNSERKLSYIYSLHFNLLSLCSFQRLEFLQQVVCINLFSFTNKVKFCNLWLKFVLIFCYCCFFADHLVFSFRSQFASVFTIQQVRGQCLKKKKKDIWTTI